MTPLAALVAPSDLGARATSELQGLMVGGFTLRDEIGRGATSVVYRAEHPLLNSTAAVKVMHRELSMRRDLTERFILEARAVAALRHPHIVQIHDLVAIPDGRLCTVMEYVDGPTLEALAGRAPMAEERVRGILLQLCSALSSIHRMGIVHRDLKAQNVMVGRSGPRDHVKLLDFGLVKSEAAPSGLTQPGTVVGTPHYMAPEQVKGEPVDRRTDVYALGVLAYRLLTGRVPFDGSPVEVMFHHAWTAPPEPVHIDPGMWRLISRAMAKRREDRFQDMAQVARALRESAPERPAALTRHASSPFAASIEGSTVTLRFASEAAFDHVERYELSAGRVFVPGTPPTTPGLLRALLHIPGRHSIEAPATLLGIFDRNAAEKHGIQEGFALTLRGVFSPHETTPPPTGPAQLRPRARRSAQHFPITFGPTKEPIYLGMTTNISVHGLGIVSPYLMPAGSSLHLAVMPPTKELIHCEGTVVWARSRSGRGSGAMGVELLRIERQYQRLLAGTSACGDFDETSAAQTDRVRIDRQ